MWSGVGIMLITLATEWLVAYPGKPWLYIIAGFIVAMIFHHFIFLRIVNKNLIRLKGLPDRPCAFSFISWKSYLVIIFMVSLGITLRHSSLPKQDLAIMYTGIGGGLLLSSIRYFRKLFSKI